MTGFEKGDLVRLKYTVANTLTKDTFRVSHEDDAERFVGVTLEGEPDPERPWTASAASGNRPLWFLPDQLEKVDG